MADIEKKIFINLFREACEKCFTRPLTEPLKEPDAKRLSDEVHEKTGLVIGWKSIKNFSLYATQPDTKRVENPSIATLDTFARYVQDAPVTDDAKRKATESHYPYWYNYKSRFIAEMPAQKATSSLHRRTVLILSVAVIIVAATFFLSRSMQTGQKNRFVENFSSLGVDSLRQRGWILKNKDVEYWNRRGDVPGHMTLYTLLGDNWGGEPSARLKNVLMREIESECFSAEIHLTNFVPQANWQQAGILLSDDSTFNGKVLRLSLAYNNFFGGFDRPSEIIIQVVGSNAPGGISKPEEIAHFVLFEGNPEHDSLIYQNLSRSALKIEKRRNHYRFLFTNGKMESFAFKEAAHRDFDLKPRYVAIFAMQGLADSQNPMPASFDFFNVIDIDCD